MSLTDVEADPLAAKDPLDCSEENIKTENHVENWIKSEPIFHIKSEEESETGEVGPTLRTRRGSIINGSDEEESNGEWRTRRKRGRRQMPQKEGSETDSNDETVLSNRRKPRTRRGYPCNVCKRFFSSASLLNNHVTNECQFLSCQHCEKTFSDEKALMEHVHFNHDGRITDEAEGSGTSTKKNERSRKYYQQLKTVRRYQCEVCDKTFITSAHLATHMYSHSSKKWICDGCGKNFSCERSLMRHKDTFPGEHWFPCKYCDESFSNTKTLTEHVHFHHNGGIPDEAEGSGTPTKKNERCRKYYQQLKNIRRYQCEVCHKTFITSGHLTTHMYSHSNKKWICDGCGKNFSCERSLMRHKDTFPEEHWFPCKYCDVTFFRLPNIVKHMEIKHPEALLNGDSTCDDNLKMKPNSNGENTCQKCCKTFDSPELLAEHKKSHPPVVEVKLEEDAEEEETNYKCEVCAKEFVSLEGFEYHQAHQHVDKEAKKKRNLQQRVSLDCRLCSAKFATKTSLQTHLKTHNVTRNVQVKSGSHQCCICPRSFTSSDGLKYHLATHTGERRYSCGQCGKRFIKKTHLSEHIATHSEVKYFKCPRCPRTFSTHSAYRKHMKHFPGPHSFPCCKCGKLFTKESMIEKHMCVDLVKITLAPEVKALLSEDMIEEYLCIAEEQMAQELKTENSKSQAEESDPTSHSCYKCFKVFPSLSSLQAHQNDHIGKQSYQCRFCPESFKRADSFGSHIRNHLGSTPYMCLKCNRKFISPFTLSMHARNYPGDHSFTCQKCQRWFPSEMRLDKHECILQNSEYFKCACGLRFISWNDLLQHAGTKPFKCCSCELTYPTLTALARHIKKHTGAKPFSCEVCGKSFRAKNNYLNHKNIHRNEKEFQCEHCEYKSKSQKRMDFHLFRKHDIGSNVTKSTLCPICGVIFPYISQMKKHLESEHGNEFVLEDASGEKKSLPAELCTLCGKMLNNKYTLANHMKKVHGPNVAKKDRKIKCEFCDEKFHTTKKLARHAEVHEAPGLRKCEICHKEFYFAKELRKHMRKHDTNKPFSCSRCGKHFKVSVSLKYHSTICGNVTNRTSGERRKKKEATTETSNVDLIYGHINQIDLNNQPYMLQVYSG